MRRLLAILVAFVVGAVASMAISPARAQAPTCNGKAATTAGPGTDGDDVIIGTEGGDHISGGAGNDTICTLGGNDGVSGGPGDDFLDGGEGTDLVHYDAFDQGAVTVDLASGHATGGAGADTLVVGSFENVWTNCSTTNADTLIGDGDANVLVGGSGDDHLVGNGGNDTLYGTDPSYGYTDAICWRTPDSDVLEGGDGDDFLLGQAGSNDLDGGAGNDALDGGTGTNHCRNGERYARCATEEPPAPPAACDDGVDNDGDGHTDAASDADCASRVDPTEQPGDDPGCFDGLDNDGDGHVDFPEDIGCYGLEDRGEYNCAYCPPRDFTIRYDRAERRFLGEMLSHFGCSPDRPIRLRRMRPGRDPVVGSTQTDRHGRWIIELQRAPRPGRFYVVAPRHVFENDDGDVVSCRRLRSRTIPAP